MKMICESILLIGLWGVSPLFSQVRLTPPSRTDPLQRTLSRFALQDETIFDGIAKLDEITELAFSIEYALKQKLSDPPLQVPRFTKAIESTTVEGVLDWLCTLDSNYTWARDGNQINLYPTSIIKDSEYLMNRSLSNLQISRASTPDSAVAQAVLQLPGERQQIANIRTGGNWNFPEPWTAKLSNVTLRQVANLAAQRLGPKFGWQFTGASNFRIIIFHNHLLRRSQVLKEEIGSARTEIH